MASGWRSQEHQKLEASLVYTVKETLSQKRKGLCVSDWGFHSVSTLGEKNFYGNPGSHTQRTKWPQCSLKLSFDCITIIIILIDIFVWGGQNWHHHHLCWGGQSWHWVASSIASSLFFNTMCICYMVIAYVCYSTQGVDQRTNFSNHSSHWGLKEPNSDCQALAASVFTESACCPHFSFWDTVSHWTWRSLVGISWLSSKP